MHSISVCGSCFQLRTTYPSFVCFCAPMCRAPVCTCDYTVKARTHSHQHGQALVRMFPAGSTGKRIKSIMHICIPPACSLGRHCVRRSILASYGIGSAFGAPVVEQKSAVPPVDTGAQRRRTPAPGLRYPAWYRQSTAQQALLRLRGPLLQLRSRWDARLFRKVLHRH